MFFIRITTGVRSVGPVRESSVHFFCLTLYSYAAVKCNEHHVLQENNVVKFANMLVIILLS